MKLFDHKIDIRLYHGIYDYFSEIEKMSSETIRELDESAILKIDIDKFYQLKNVGKRTVKYLEDFIEDIKLKNKLVSNVLIFKDNRYWITENIVDREGIHDIHGYAISTSAEANGFEYPQDAYAYLYKMQEKVEKEK